MKSLLLGTERVIKHEHLQMSTIKLHLLKIICSGIETQFQIGGNLNNITVFALGAKKVGS